MHNPFFIMFVGSICIHMFLMPLLMLDTITDFRLSPTQFYGAVCMACSMVILETFMHTLSANGWIATIATFVIALICLRYQFAVTDTEFLHDMIPHHSMAVLTSKAILQKTQNPDIANLAQNILATQVKEIEQMKQLAAY